MFRGGALYLTVFIAFILAVLCTLLIYTGYYHTLFYLRNTELLRLYDNARSGMNYLLTNPETEFNKTQETRLFDEENDLVFLRKEHWGIYEIYNVKATWKNSSVNLISLTGDKSQVRDKTGLYLADHGKYLSVGGSTHLSGNTYLPKIGIRRAYIDGRVYSGSRLIYGDEKRSDEKLPVPYADFLTRIKNYISGQTQERDSLVNIESLWKNDEYRQSFQYRSAYVELGSNSHIDELNCKGKIILYSKNKVTIGRDNTFEDVIIIAPQIKVQSGFKGSVQLFASDTIIIEPDCIFDYPSGAGIIGSGLGKPYMNIGKGSSIEGVVFVYSENNELAQPELYIDEETGITGFVYCNGTVEHKGKITGCLYCDQFELKTPRAFYVNHLLNATVDPLSLPDYFVSCNILENTKNKEVLKWLN